MISKKIKSIIISVTMSITLLFSCTVFADGNQVKVNVERLAGADRYETNSKIVDKGWMKTQSIILVNSQMYADAIVSSPLSKKLTAPILLTDGNVLSQTAADKIKFLGAKNIYIMGGTGVISSSIENNLKSQGYNVIRLAGQDRYETSIAVAKYVNDNPSTIFFTDGDNWEDALSIAPIAAKLQAPIILGSRTSSSDKVKDYLSNIPYGKITILDDNAFSGTKGVSGLAGANLLIAKNSLEMNENIIKQYKDQLNFNSVYLASASTFADALSGSSLAAENSNPIILYNRDNRNNAYDIINSSKNIIQNVEVLGGTGVINDDGISNIFDTTGLVESTDGKTTNSSGSDSSQGNNENLTIDDFYNFVGDNYANKIKTLVDNIPKSDIDEIEVDGSPTGYKDEQLFLTKKGANNIDGSIEIIVDKESKEITLNIINYSVFSKQTTGAFCNYGISILSTEYKSLMAQDLVNALVINDNLTKEYQNDINKQIANKGTQVYSDSRMPMEVNTYYGSYDYGLAVIGGSFENLIGIKTSIQ